MYCPRCGHQTISDELRFCSYCGLKLGVVKASLAEAEEVPLAGQSNTSTSLILPRQRDINIGVILMFAGAVLASFVAGTTGLGLGRARGATVLWLFYLALVVLSGPIMKGILKLLSWEDGANLPASRKGMGFGATLMFVSTVVLAISSLLTYGRMKSTPLFIGVGLAFAVLLLIGRHLMRGMQYLLTGEATAAVPKSVEAADQTARLSHNFDGPSLAAAQGTPVTLFGTQKVITAEILAPSSITDHTTNLLENK